MSGCSDPRNRRRRRRRRGRVVLITHVATIYVRRESLSLSLPPSVRPFLAAAAVVCTLEGEKPTLLSFTPDRWPTDGRGRAAISRTARPPARSFLPFCFALPATDSLARLPARLSVRVCGEEDRRGGDFKAQNQTTDSCDHFICFAVCAARII